MLQFVILKLVTLIMLHYGNVTLWEHVTLCGVKLCGTNYVDCRLILKR